MKEVRRLNIEISEEDMKEIEFYFDVLYSKGTPINKTYNIKRNSHNYIVNMYESDLLGGKFMVDIYELNDGIETKILGTVVKKKEDLHSVFYRNNDDYELYFRIDVKIKREDLNAISSYVLNRFDSVDNLYKLLNAMTYNDFTKDFELVEFCVLAINNIKLLTPVGIDVIKEKLNYFGYDKDYLPVSIYNFLKEFKDIHMFEWEKSTTKDILKKIVSLLVLEVHQRGISDNLSVEQIKSSISTLYGMYIYKFFYEYISL